MEKPKNRINWQAYNSVHAKTTNSLCVGEERTLTDEEIIWVNDRLAAATVIMGQVNDLFNLARHRFGKFEQK